jgi:hypothetical protein
MRASDPRILALQGNAKTDRRQSPFPRAHHHRIDRSAVLSTAQIEDFVRDGFVRVERAFPRHLADEGRALLWQHLPCVADDPSTWTRAVIRLGHYDDEAFNKAVNSSLLHAAFDQLVGRGRWRPRWNLGTFPVRFPSPDDPGDTGWHIDVSFPGPTGSWDETKDFSDWRANVSSRGRALLMLFLFSDIGKFDAPTRIKVGSHLDIARLLQPAGEAGMSHAMLHPFATKLERPEALAIGNAGDVYLCHPFLVHAAQMHRGLIPRFLAQPPLHPAEPLLLDRADADYSPVERAIRYALQDGQS